MTGTYRNRTEAGHELATKLLFYKDSPNVIVLALPRGGVPVAYEVARNLHAPLDIFLVRKLGVPGNEELAMGALALGGHMVLNEGIIQAANVSKALLQAVVVKEQAELVRRDRLYRGGRPPPRLQGRTVLLTDDGLATGATMRAAVAALREQAPARIVIAVPVASQAVCAVLRDIVDDIQCARQSQTFYGVGQWYEDFSQVTDQEVRDLLSLTAAPYPVAPGAPVSIHP